jgi:4-oxalocrotonate tautomerase
MRLPIVCGVLRAVQCSGFDVRDVPDVRGGRPLHHRRMQLIAVKVVAGVFTALQKQEIVERLTDAMVEISGENTRAATWCVLEEVATGEWAVGGEPLTTDDVRALARGD